jgi:hypothetical protein
VLVNGCQQRLGPGQPKRHVANIKVLHVVGTFQVLPDVALPSTEGTWSNSQEEPAAQNRGMGRQRLEPVAEQQQMMLPQPSGFRVLRYWVHGMRLMPKQAAAYAQ